MLFQNLDPASSEYGAMYHGPGILALANTKNPDGSWKWRIGITPRGILAESVDIEAAVGVHISVKDAVMELVENVGAVSDAVDELDGTVTGLAAQRIGSTNLMDDSCGERQSLLGADVIYGESGYNGRGYFGIERSGYAGSSRTSAVKDVTLTDYTAGTKYTLSGWYRVNASPALDYDNNTIVLRCYDSAGTILGDISGKSIPKSAPKGIWTYFSATAGLPAGTTKADVRLSLDRNGSILCSMVQLEVGDKATDWKPSTADLAASITAVRTEMGTAFDLTAEAINASAQKITKIETKLPSLATETYVNQRYGNLQLTNEQFEVRIGEAEGTLSGLGANTDELNNFRVIQETTFRVRPEGAIVGQAGVKTSVLVAADRVAIRDKNNNEVTRITDNNMDIENASIRKQISVGSVARVKLSDGSCGDKWIG